MYSQDRINANNVSFPVIRRGDPMDVSFLSRKLANGTITRSMVDQSRVSQGIYDRKETDHFVSLTQRGHAEGDMYKYTRGQQEATRGQYLSNPMPPPSVPSGHVDVGGVVGAAGSILGGAAAGAGLLGEAAVVGGVAAAPVLAAGAAVAGVGYGVYRLGESLHLW